MRQHRPQWLTPGPATLAGALSVLALAMIAATALAEPEPDESPLQGTGRSSEPEAEPTGVENATPPSTSDPDVALDELLKLPDSMSYQSERRHGNSREEWRSRFRESQDEVDFASQELERVKSELDETAGDAGNQWQVAPPGSNQTEVTPVSFKLREELRRKRDELEQAEKKQRALLIEADLAGVPPSWRENLN